MKSFKTLLLLIVIVLIGGLGFLYWASFVDQTTEPIAEVSEEQEAQETQEPENVGPGTYLIFQSVRTTDAGEQDWANDDTQTYTFYRLALGEATYRANPSSEDLVAFATVEHGPEFGGGLTTTIFGENLLMHRYQTSRVYDAVNGRPEEGTEQDGLMSLTGEIVKTRPEQWGSIRSKNGRYEVTWNSLYDEIEQNILVTDTLSGEIVAQVDPASIMESSRWTAEPFAMNNLGTYLYLHEVCGCEASLSGYWEVNLKTGEIRDLQKLFDLPSWSQTNLDPDTGRLLVIDEAREASSEGPFDELVPPSTVRLIDLDSSETTNLFTDEAQAYGRPLLDASGQDSYLLRPWKEGNEIWLFGLEDDEAQEAEKLTDGWVMDWVGDWLVVDDNQILSLFNLETRGSMTLVVPDGAERFEYVGSVVIGE